MGSPSGFSWACFRTPFPAALPMPCLPGCPYSVRTSTHCLRRTWPTACPLRVCAVLRVRPVFRTSHTLPPACVAGCLDPPGLHCQLRPRPCRVWPVFFGPYSVRASHCLRRAWQTAWTLRVCAVCLPCRGRFRPLFRTGKGCCRVCLPWFATSAPLMLCGCSRSWLVFGVALWRRCAVFRKRSVSTRC